MNDQRLNSNHTAGNGAAFSPPGKTGGNKFLYFVVIVAVVAAGIWFLTRAEGEEAVVDMGSTFTVDRGDLLISIVEGGNLKAQKSVQIECEVEGKATIVTLIPEGTYVKKGDLLVELDSSDLEERFTQQEISYENAKAAMIQAEENQKIQISQNKSNIMEGELDVEFARLELEKFLGRKEGEFGVEIKRLDLQQFLDGISAGEPKNERRTKGSLELEHQQLENEIKIADAEYLRAKDRLDWTRKLTDRGFVNNDELKADELTLEQKRINLDDAQQQKYLSETYDFPMQLKRLIADFEQAELGLERIRSRADAEMAQKEADVRSKTAQFKLQEERFNKLKEQLEFCTIKAPQDGLVVYGSQDNHRRWGGSDNDIIEEGASVRYRQTLITLPDVSVMILDTKVHESAIDKVDVGMHCVIEVDAFPDKQFHGKVSKVAILPDSQSRWLNPDLKVYSTDITLEEGSNKLKPGMSAKVEIMIDRIEDVLYVPIQSVFRRGGREVCYVLSPSGSIDIRTVQPGQTNEQFVAIEGGLEEGERVLLYTPPVSDEIEDEEEAQDGGSPDFPGREAFDGDKEGRDGSRSPTEMAGERKDRGERGGMPEISQEQREKFKKFMELPEDERLKMIEKMREEGRFPSGGGGDRGGGGSREGTGDGRGDRGVGNRGGRPAPERGEDAPVQEN